MNLSKPVLLLLAIIALLRFVEQSDRPVLPDIDSSVRQQVARVERDGFAQAFAAGRSNVQLQGQGRVTRLLADDNNGSRHQRFILQLPSGQTVLVAHNIDLAPRIEGLAKGDELELYGEYEWNPEGGVMHWTHRDPQGRREGGWIRHAGRTYR